MVFPNIGTYTGYFVNGKREGLGTFKWDVGDIYVGLWKNDKMNGNGTYTFSDGYTIRGVWSDNKITSKATNIPPPEEMLASLLASDNYSILSVSALLSSTFLPEQSTLLFSTYQNKN